MAFNQSAYAATYLPSTGIQPNIVFGIVALDSGAITVTVPGNRQVITAWAESQTANAARVSATAGATLSLAGTSSDLVAWFAVVK
jgi:hypothetical protein